MTDPERDALKQEFDDLLHAVMEQRNIAQNQLAQMGAAVRALQRKIKGLEDELAEKAKPQEPKPNGATQHAAPSH